MLYYRKIRQDVFTFSDSKIIPINQTIVIFIKKLYYENSTTVNIHYKTQMYNSIAISLVFCSLFMTDLNRSAVRWTWIGIWPFDLWHLTVWSLTFDPLFFSDIWPQCWLEHTSTWPWLWTLVLFSVCCRLYISPVNNNNSNMKKND